MLEREISWRNVESVDIALACKISKAEHVKYHGRSYKPLYLPELQRSNQVQFGKLGNGNAL
jgi:hypothetical protein